MRLPLAIIFTLAIIFVGMLLESVLDFPYLSWVVIFVTTVWIFVDAEKIQTEKYQSFWGTKPWILALGNFLLMIVVFPAYLWLRYRIVHDEVALRDKFAKEKDTKSESHNTSLAE